MKWGTKIFIILAVLVVLGAGFLWYVGNKNNDEPLALKARIAKQDTDGDGLSDQLETWWGTDKNNPDTNGDGISDGVEIMNWDNPTATSSNKEITNLDERLQALVQNAMLKKDGALVTAELSEIPPVVTFTNKDLVTPAAENLSTITKFRDDIRKAFAPLGTLAANESAQLNRFIETGDRAALLAITTEKQKYDAMLQAGQKVVVPTSAEPLYLETLNSLEQVDEAVTYMSQVEVEPILALKSSQDLARRRSVFLLTFVPLNQYFVERGLNEKSTF